MQTFLPYPNFDHSAASLDWRRLGKQRVECSQMLAALRLKKAGALPGWGNHPATLMWEGYESAMAVYMTFVIREWISRGYENNMMLPYREDWTLSPGFHVEHYISDARKVVMPPWLGNERFHASHRSALLLKAPEFYGRFGWTEPAEDNYHWPTREGLM